MMQGWWGLFARDRKTNTNTSVISTQTNRGGFWGMSGVCRPQVKFSTGRRMVDRGPWESFNGVASGPEGTSGNDYDNGGITVDLPLPVYTLQHPLQHHPNLATAHWKHAL